MHSHVGFCPTNISPPLKTWRDKYNSLNLKLLKVTLQNELLFWFHIFLHLTPVESVLHPSWTLPHVTNGCGLTSWLRYRPTETDAREVFTGCDRGKELNHGRREEEDGGARGSSSAEQVTSPKRFRLCFIWSDSMLQLMDWLMDWFEWFWNFCRDDLGASTNCKWHKVIGCERKKHFTLQEPNWHLFVYIDGKIMLKRTGQQFPKDLDVCSLKVI